MESKATMARDRDYTHEIRDAEGEWIWLGDETSMSVIFHNLNGTNFAGKPPETYAQYLAWMRRFTAEAWPGRTDPLAPGSSIELACINGEAVARHTFAAQGTCANQGLS